MSVLSRSPHRGRRLALLCLASLSAAPLQAADAPSQLLPETVVTASRVGEGMVGSASSVITAEELARSPVRTLPELLARQPGIQVQNLYGGVNGTGSVVDLRGFGASASANTLILLNGRRLNDVDLAGVDLGSIPLASIERIEITRGSSGAVLYGDGAMGGVINIVTSNSLKEGSSAQAEFGLGSFGFREGNLAATHSGNGTAISVYGNVIDSDGYRDNNVLRQRSAVGEVRRAIESGELYLNLTGDTQHMGMPGGRKVTLTSSELSSDRSGAATPFDYADKQGIQGSVGITRRTGAGIEWIVDAGVRHKEQQSAFFSPWGAAFNSYLDTTLDTYSLTPRLKMDHQLGDMAAKLTAGLDLSQSDYLSDRAVQQGKAAKHQYDLEQRTLALYFQERLTVQAGSTLAAGVRVQNVDVAARDHFNASAPASGSPVAARSYDHNETDYAAHLGFEQQLWPEGTLFGRVGRSMRLPTVDERVGGSPWGAAVTFDLKTQTAQDYELGLRGKWDKLNWQSSLYWMDLRNELHYSTATFTNVNLDPTRRKGIENSLRYQLSDTVRLKGQLTYTRAQFTEGTWQGHDVPLVSRWSGGAGLSWDLPEQKMGLDLDLQQVGSRRFDNDQANFQPLIPEHTLLNLRVAGDLDWAGWSVAVENLLDRDYYDYGIASSATYGTYNAYPMPGRTIMGRLSFHLP
ncbi:MAG: TonB-dependent receptor [Magnetococcales bacterium]|nr:TonB-dependent receptor [Magnetococcales bacterium]MBF0114244.1 TonB-dependent receptor [Magnetococcales bacterium]